MADQKVLVWTKTTETVELEDAGDIMNPLIRLQVRYIQEAEIREQAALAVGKPGISAFYRDAATNIGRLIIQ